MRKKEHRLITRWFNRKIDLGALLTGLLFVFIWALLPAGSSTDAPTIASASISIHPTRNALSVLPSYQRPDLMLVPSPYTFAARWQLPDSMMRVPQYVYASTPAGIDSAPAGMGSLVEPGMGLNHQNYLYDMPASRRTRPFVASVSQPASLHVRYADGLEGTRLVTDAAVWQAELQGPDSWHFAFWVAFGAKAGDSMVFVEERSGDLERDLRLLRIVQRPDVWEGASGAGIVWLRYQPASGEDHADTDN
ncbi:MAG: hypothetical protein ACNA71_06350 [Kiritimatiellia bacterium]